MIRALFGGLLLLGDPTGARAAAPKATVFRLDPVSGKTLQALELCYLSGLRLHLLQREAAGHVAVGALIDGGLTAERPDEIGAAHLLEHL
jgi:hypothetical protein